MLWRYPDRKRMDRDCHTHSHWVIANTHQFIRAYSLPDGSYDTPCLWNLTLPSESISGGNFAFSGIFFPIEKSVLSPRDSPISLKAFNHACWEYQPSGTGSTIPFSSEFFSPHFWTTPYHRLRQEPFVHWLRLRVHKFCTVPFFDPHFFLNHSVSCMVVRNFKGRKKFGIKWKNLKKNLQITAALGSFVIHEF